MKLISIFLVFLTCLTAKAENLSWNELETNSTYYLTNNIVLNDEVTLKKGSAYLLTDFYTGEVPVLFYTLKDLLCTDTSLKSEMVLFNPEPEDTTDDKSIGVELVGDCNLVLYVETKHVYSKSTFNQ